ncbi:MAG: ABC transporter ATP-binding protein, partial [Acidobacteriaceae bacterium]|nr:ABC transporter ATP-binding protein [Acidobacteriaceae bacterium]
ATMRTALRFDSVSKRYRIRSGPESGESGGKSRFTFSRTHASDFWALKNVSFQVQQGESLGIIGHNGAGKSTVLKLLSNITAPNKGQITINGRISALLEVGSGFHPELTGRENVYLSGSILGMRRAEITQKLESIIDFAGVRPFIDLPVKRYSSGMYVRLGFSIAAHLDPDILLLDEVLAVGDYAFQEKCKQRIAEMHRQGTTMVFISHDLNAVRAICQRAVLLQRGEVMAEGTPDEVIRRYTETASFHQRPQITDERRLAEITGVFFYDSHGNRTNSFKTGDPVSVRINYFVHRHIPQGGLSLYFLLSDCSIAVQWSTSLSGRPLDMREGPGSVEFSCNELGLQPGVYQIDATIEKSGTAEEYEWQHACATIHVDAGKIVRGAFYMPHNWHRAAVRPALAERAAERVN